MTQSPQTPSLSDHLALAGGLVAISTSAIFIRLCHSPATQIAFYRLVGAGAIFIFIQMIRHRSLRIGGGDGLAALIGAVFLAAHFYLWISALFMTSINSAVMLLATQPLFALILQQVVLRKAATRRNLISLLIGIGGTAVIAWGDFHLSSLAGLGDVYAVISACMASCYLVTASFRRGPLLTYLGSLYSMAGVMLILLALLRGDGLLPSHQTDWLWFALLMLVPTLIGHTLINRAVEHFPAYVVNLSILTEPLLTSIGAWFVFGERIPHGVWLGGPLIALAVIVEFV
jgi:drug/metabolite transporter (DMT)-like permease